MEPTSEGRYLIERYVLADRKVERLVKDLEIAKAQRIEEEQKVGEWLTPPDAVNGENFCVWFGDSLIRSTVCMTGPKYRVHIRKRGKSIILI